MNNFRAPYIRICQREMSQTGPCRGFPRSVASDPVHFDGLVCQEFHRSTQYMRTFPALYSAHYQPTIADFALNVADGPGPRGSNHIYISMGFIAPGCGVGRAQGLDSVYARENSAFQGLDNYALYSFSDHGVMSCYLAHAAVALRDKRKNSVKCGGQE